MKNKNWSRGKLDILYNKDKKTLQEIGDLYAVSRERIRQVMEEFGLTRGGNRGEIARAKDWHYYKSLEDYFEKSGERQDIVTDILRRLMSGVCCSECGKAKNIHIHHIIYPAIKLEDIQILCASCHHMKHRGDMTYLRQIDIYNQYMGGNTPQTLARKYGVSRILIYKILRKIRNGNASIRGENHFGRLSRQPKNAST